MLDGHMINIRHCCSHNLKYNKIKPLNSVHVKLCQ